MATLFVSSLVSSLLFSIAGETARGDWPEFRGPMGQGHSSAQNLPVTWSATENVIWKQPLPGEGWSSPSLAGGRIYLTAAVPAEDGAEGDLDLRLLVLESKSGQVLKSTKVFRQVAADAPKIHSKNSHASPTPLIAGDRVYVHFGHQGTAALDLNGEVVWSTRDLSYSPVHGNGGSPILAGEHLIFSGDGSADPFIVALHRATGAVAWKSLRGGDAPRKFSFSTPLLIEAAGRSQVISPCSNAVIAYDPTTGNEIWRAAYEGYSVIPRPIFGHGLVFISTGYDSPSVMAIRPDGEGDVTETHVAWTLTKGAPHTPSLLLVGDELYMVSDRGVATCVDARTGEQHWQERLGGNFSASPLFADGRIYLQSEEGVGHVIKPGRTFQSLGENKLEERTLASYAVEDGRLYVRGASHLYCIGAGP